jgi:uncharacterized protein (TIGR03084 family)
MDKIIGALQEQHAELDGLLSGLQAEDWARPAPDAPGWTVADVVLHLAQTDELVVASGQDRFLGRAQELLGPAVSDSVGNVDDFAGQIVARERGGDPGQLYQRWQDASRSMREMLAASDPRRPMQWVVNSIPARTLATTRLSEAWIHTYDVAGALGVELTPGERLWHIARLGWRTIPYAYARAGIPAPEGPVAVRLTAPDGHDWNFEPDEPPATVVTGPALEFCLIAARRLDPSKSAVRATGPDAANVLALIRTYA